MMTRDMGVGISACLIAVLVALLVPAIVLADDPDGKSGVTPNTIKLPSGPGSLDGIGQSFEPDLNSGTAVFSVPLEVPPGRAGHQPELNLTYNGGWGQSEVALGWRLSVPCLQRQTDKGLPAYTSADTLIYIAGGQELIALDDGTLRFKNEGAFTRFIWVGQGLEGQLRDGQKITFGQTAESRITTPAGVFMWCADTNTDGNGNVIEYHYFQDGGRPYLSEIRYNPAADGMAQTVSFTYQSRPDFVIDYQSRHPVSTTLRLARIEMRSRGQLVRAYQLAYFSDPSQSLLASVTRIGSDGVSALPPLAFTYTQFNPQSQPIVTMNPSPAVVPGGNVDLVMLDKDPLPDLIIANSGDHRYVLNLGHGQWATTTAKMTDPDTGLLSSPSAKLSDNGAFLMDADGNGFADLVLAGSSSAFARFYPNRGRAFWEAPVDFTNNPSFSFESDDVRLSDQNFDKQVDVMATTPLGISCWLNQGNGQWSNQLDQPEPDPTQELMFDNPQIKLADFNGDGLDDLGLVRSRSVSYYPGRGDCLFAGRVDMLNPPDVGALDLDRLRTADINADGRTDLVYVDYSQVTYYLNQGNRWSDGTVISNTPALRSGVILRFADMDASGTVDLLFADGQQSRYQYLDFAGGIRPNLLARIDNSLGQMIDIHYSSSTEYLIAARVSGQPWQNPMPLAVTVVSRVDVTDLNSGQIYRTNYAYRDGAWDGVEHEFRGFEWVDKTEAGDVSAPTTVTRYHFDTGLTEECRKGQILEQAVLSAGGECAASAHGCYQQQVNHVATRELASNSRGQAVRYAFAEQSTTSLFENTASPRVLRRAYAYDDYGNLAQDFNYGEVQDGNLGYGNDELLTTNTYAVNTTAWILNRLAEVHQTDLVGSTVSQQRRYYDGTDFAGLPLGQVTRGNLTRQEDNLGPAGSNRWVQTVRNRYDAYGNLAASMDPNGRLGSDGNPDDTGHWTALTYDSTFHTYPVAEAIQLGGGKSLVMTADYDLALGVITRAVDFNGQEWRFGYDPLARLTAIVEPGDSAALPTQVFTYILASPVSSVWTASRETSGAPGVYRAVTYVDGLGRTVQTRSEGEDGKIVVSDAVTFNLRGAVAEVYLPYFADAWTYAPSAATLAKTALAYDSMGRVVSTTQPDSSTAATQYLPLEQVVFDEEDTNATSPHANTPTTFRFDGLNRQVQTIEKNGDDLYTTSFAYDAPGNLTTITDTLGNVKRQTFDWLRHKVWMDDPDRGEMEYAYDDAGNLLETTDAQGHQIQFDYDGANRLVTENHVVTPEDETPEVVYHYDADLAPEYPDAANTRGRLAWVEDTSGREYLSYDARGNLAGRIKRTLPLGGLPALDFVTLTRYDAMARPVEMTYPDGTVLTYQYNDQNLLEAIPGYVNGIDYLASGQRGALTTTDGVRTTYQYDVRQRLMALTAMHTTSGAVLQDLRYGFDGVSNILAIDDVRPGRTAADDDTRTFAYDDLYRLTSVSYAAGSQDSIAYTYDPIGNLVRQTSNVAAANLGDLHYGQEAGPHALTEVGGQPWRYDQNGNLASKPGFTYAWDSRDRLVAANGSNGVGQEHTYDYVGERTSKEVTTAGGSQTVLYPDQAMEVRGDQLIKYVFAGDQRVAEVRTVFNRGRLIRGFAGAPQPLYGFDANDDGVITPAEVAGRGGDAAIIEFDEIDDALTLFFAHTEDVHSPLSFATVSAALKDYRGHGGAALQTGTVFYHPDHLGSSTLLTEAQGAVVERAAYYPYGAERNRAGDATVTRRFTSKELDYETGLYYYGARFYDATIARFLSADELRSSRPEMSYAEPQSLNLYSYTGNNPIKYTDPTGQAEVSVSGAETKRFSWSREVDKNNRPTSDRIQHLGYTEVYTFQGDLNPSGNLKKVTAVSADAEALRRVDIFVAGKPGMTDDFAWTLQNTISVLEVSGSGGVAKNLRGIPVFRAGLEVGGSLLADQLKAGFNYLGSNVSFGVKARLGVGYGYRVGSKTSVSYGPFSFSVEVGDAVTTKPPPEITPKGGLQGLVTPKVPVPIEAPLPWPSKTR